MLFPTLAFGVFFLFVYFTAWSLDRENGRRKIFLLLASWFFYAQWDWRFVGLLIASAVLNWGVAALIASSDSPGRRKWLVALGVALNLIILGFFKYYGFFVEQAVELLNQFGWERDAPLLQIVLPIGISFFTFQGISYVVDVHRGKTPPARSLVDVMLLMSFFPHLVAGPIVRASDLLPQFDRVPRLTREMAALGLLLIAWGLFKKTVIASELAVRLVDPVFFDPSAYGALDIAAATYGYAVQIYCDFSAYSDMAIGLAALLGYSFPRNFDQPYRAGSMQQFWRRWHISLSSWLRDYLYVPLGGGRKGLVSSCINIMITMLLGGLWHGAAWTFIAWGALHGAVQAVERVWRHFREGKAGLPHWLGVIVTFHIVCLGWILFRAESFDLAMQMLEGLTRMAPIMVLTPFLLALIIGGIAMHWLPPRAVEGLAVRVKEAPAITMGVLVGIMILLVEAMRPEGVAPFIYFQF
ncbi:MBOAT family protein [Brevundimonas sp. BAL450]|jgi:alginate O-acetyltransferase complex protein AlgI|uniref:Probable alginate O-acetylase AlgI n=1 Tax=Brevundimonas abyssalis TAR-001 TaxID=1391729 RepID=A0A8E0KIV1_9CAUL|nr:MULTISPECIES: MBOAT family protein [Brevundimonas]MBG7616653.1 MBOAT family protein [Brevundimonas sp. BAL450]GAD58541.1 probable poly(beta-D-mannuronate) O-acetylase [Brevundimonas abyssalis TAR-001]